MTDPVSVVAHRHGTDDGVRGEVRHVLLPPPRTSVDCEYAALALLDDATEQCWSGEYQTWSAFLPEGAQDIKIVAEGLDEVRGACGEAGERDDNKLAAVGQKLPAPLPACGEARALPRRPVAWHAKDHKQSRCQMSFINGCVVTWPFSRRAGSSSIGLYAG